MNRPGDHPSRDADPTPVLPDDPSIDGVERVATDAADGPGHQIEAEESLGHAPVSTWPEVEPREPDHTEIQTSRAELLRSSAIVGVGTGLSRLTGLLRVL